MSPHSVPVAIAGAGRMGTALGLLLRERGVPIAAIAGRDPDRTAAAARFIGGETRPVTYSQLPTHAGRILVAVPDDAIESIATLLAGAGMSHTRAPGTGAVIHTSGARGPEALASLETRGVSCAALHPLQTVTTPQQGLSALPGSAFGISGSGPALEWALEIVALLEGQQLIIAPGMRPLYHAAAVMASNYIVALIDSAVILMEAAGVGPEQALQALAPLIRASAENALEGGPSAALTGPIERGDAGTVIAHLQALGKAPETVRELYRRAGLHAAEMAERKGSRRGEVKLVLREGAGG